MEVRMVPTLTTVFFQFLPELQYDSWVTIGHAPEDGTAQQSLTIANSPNQNWVAAFEAGGDIVIDDIFGGLWSIFNDGNDQGLAGADNKVLLAQLTTDGTITAQLAVQYFPDYVDGVGADGLQDTREYVNLSTTCGPNSPCGYDDATANTDDGSCVTLDTTGCVPVFMDGYSYSVVEIGDQCWFAENLRTTVYRNGDAIPASLTDGDWSSTTSGATCGVWRGQQLMQQLQS